MTKSNLNVFLGLFLLAFGFIMVFTSLTGMTGFFISEDMSTSLNAILGLVPIAAGFMILFFGRSGDELEGLIYEALLTRNAYGHHTERVEDVVRKLARRGTTPDEVKEAIEGAVRNGALSYSGGGSSVSISMDKSALSRAIRNYGLDDHLKKRVEDLRDKGGASGVR